MRFVLEATTASFWVADRLSELGHDVRVVDPNRTKAIGAALIKHDKLDARLLAQLAAADLLAEIRVPTPEERLRRLPITLCANVG
jgi:transposase